MTYRHSVIEAIWQEAELAQRRYYGVEVTRDDQRTAQLLQALMVEASEALQCIPSHKAWGRGERATDRPALISELADTFLFVLACAIWQGLSQDDFMQAVASKQAYNSRRADHKQAETLVQTYYQNETACE